MRKLQQAHDKKMFSDRSTEDMVSSIKLINFLRRRWKILKVGKITNYLGSDNNLKMPNKWVTQWKTWLVT